MNPPGELEEQNDDDDDDSYDDSDYTDDEDEEEFSIELEAAKERARHHFRLKRWDLTTVEFEAYAATRISSWIRGIQSRQFFFELKCWREDEKDARAAVEIAERDLKQAKASQLFYKKAASMTRPQWKIFAATLIQSKWRSIRQKRAYEKDKINRSLELGLKINWIQNEMGAWIRTLG
jgi:hypothetical protein